MSAIVDLPEVTRKRMLILQNLLQSWQSEKITSVQISEITGWKDSLIRHDLWLLGYNKGISNGYLKDDLQEAISLALGFESEQKNCCIVGLNRLGAALLDDATTEGSVFKIKAGFDSNVNRVEILRSTFPLYPATEMNWVIKQEKITLAILTVADKDAQSMCDRLVKAGVTGIVNMTNSVLRVPENVKLENLSILNSLKIVS
jgi:redox-sensing transcriptional repressor